MVLLAAPGETAFAEATVDRLTDGVAAAAFGVIDTGNSVDRDRSSGVRVGNLERKLLDIYSGSGTLDRNILGQGLSSSCTDVAINDAVIHLEES